MSIRSQVRRCLLIEVDNTPRHIKLQRLSQDKSTTDAERELAAQKSRETKYKPSDSTSPVVHYMTGYHQPSKIKSVTKSAVEPFGFKFHKTYRINSAHASHIFKHEDGREVEARLTKSRKQTSYWQPNHKKEWVLRPRSFESIETDQELHDLEKNTKKFDTLPDLLKHLNPERIE